MQEMKIIVPKMIDWIEDNLEQVSILDQVSRHVGYSPWYVSVAFHDVTGMTLREYVTGRRLSQLTKELIENDVRIIDLAVKYGYSSQEALTRAFKGQFGITPAAYRKKPIPIPMQIKKNLQLYMNTIKKENNMDEKRLAVRVEHIPAHKYLGIWESRVDNYCDFWNYHGCDEVCGIVDSCDKIAHKIVTAHTAGWNNGKRTYFYGTGMPLNYTGPVPEGFELREIPASDYIVFSYPTFDFVSENADVMGAVEKLAWNFNPAELGYEWNEEACPDYQRHYPEKLGYQILRPVKEIS